MYLLVFIKLEVTNDYLPLCSDGSSTSDISFSSLKFSNIQKCIIKQISPKNTREGLNYSIKCLRLSVH